MLSKSEFLSFMTKVNPNNGNETKSDIFPWDIFKSNNFLNQNILKYFNDFQSWKFSKLKVSRLSFWIKLRAYGSGQHSVNFVKFLRTPFLQNNCGRLLLQLLNETHLEVVKGLIQLRGFNQYINNKSSSERCY